MTARRELLLTCLARFVQSAEALYMRFPRMDELLSLLSREHKMMINSFYQNGYFVPKGDAYEAFKAVLDDYGIEAEEFEAWDEITYEAIQKELKSVPENLDLVNDAFAFIKAFDDAESG